MKPAPLLHGAALLIALCVQSMNTPLAGAWLFFHLAGCACMYDPDQKHNLTWKITLSWLVALGVSTFLLMPVTNGAAWMWVLSALPMLALSLNKDQLKPYLKVFLAILLAYAAGLIIQYGLGVQYTTYNYAAASGRIAVAWPMIDPNNAAAVINFGLIPCFYLGLRKPKYLVLTAVFIAALWCTASKAGALAAAIGCSILIFECFGNIAWLVFSFPVLGLVTISMPILQTAIEQRLPIWEASLPLLVKQPWTGLGLGSFGAYYQTVRTENYTGGWFAHNDLLQFGIELGLPITILFCVLVGVIAIKTCRENIVSACVLLAVFLQSMVEFQFYVPAISILAGVALAHHTLHQRA